MSQQMIAALNTYRVARIHRDPAEIAAADAVLAQLTQEESA